MMQDLNVFIILTVIITTVPKANGYTLKEHSSGSTVETANKNDEDDSALQYVKDLYATVQTSKVIDDVDELYDDYHQEPVNQVVTFISRESTKERIDSSTELIFDLQTDTDPGDFLFAQLRLFYRPDQQEHVKCKVTIYDTRSRKLLATTKLGKSDNSRWLSFKIYEDSIVDNEQFSVTLETRKNREKVAVKDCGIALTKDRRHFWPVLANHYSVEDEGKFEIDLHSHLLRKKRSVFAETMKKHFTDGDKNNNTTTDNCGYKSHYVVFADIGHDDIVSPTGFNAGICTGECHLYSEGSPHATLQSIMHNIQEDIPQPCCAPSEYETLSVIMSDSKGKAVFHSFKSMKAVACKCQ